MLICLRIDIYIPLKWHILSIRSIQCQYNLDWTKSCSIHPTTHHTWSPPDDRNGALQVCKYTLPCFLEAYDCLWRAAAALLLYWLPFHVNVDGGSSLHARLGCHPAAVARQVIKSSGRHALQVISNSEHAKVCHHGCNYKRGSMHTPYY